MNTEHDEDDCMIVLSEQSDVTTAEHLQGMLLDRSRAGVPVVVSGGAVGRVSTAVVQLLLAAAADARARGSVFQLVDPSQVLADALADLGVAADLGY